jgi:hypothetical protein
MAPPVDYRHATVPTKRSTRNLYARRALPSLELGAVDHSENTANHGKIVARSSGDPFGPSIVVQIATDDCV